MSNDQKNQPHNVKVEYVDHQEINLDFWLFFVSFSTVSGALYYTETSTFEYSLSAVLFFLCVGVFTTYIFVYAVVFALQPTQGEDPK